HLTLTLSWKERELWLKSSRRRRNTTLVVQGERPNLNEYGPSAAQAQPVEAGVTLLIDGPWKQAQRTALRVSTTRLGQWQRAHVAGQRAGADMRADLRVDLQVAVHQIAAIEDVGGATGTERLGARIGDVGVRVAATDGHREPLHAFVGLQSIDPDPVLVGG